MLTFKQFNSDGITATGTVAIGQGSSFAPRKTAPVRFLYKSKSKLSFPC